MSKSGDNTEDDPQSLMTARPPPGLEGSDVYSASTVASHASADLLELVREAEEAAKVDVASRRSSPRIDVGPALASDRPQYVDVDDEAVDAPPSVAPLRSSSAASSLPAPPPHARSVARSAEGSASSSDSARQRANEKARSSRPPPPVFTPIEAVRVAPVSRLPSFDDAPASTTRARPSSSHAPKREVMPTPWHPAIAIATPFVLAVLALVLLASAR